MIWALILLGEIVLCLAEPKSFVYVSEIEDDDYPPPIDFRYYDRQRYIPPYLQKYSLTSKQNLDINPSLVGAKEQTRNDNGKTVPSVISPFDSSTSSRIEKDPPSTANKPKTPSLPTYGNTGPSSLSRSGKHSSPSRPKINPSLVGGIQNKGPTSYITFHPPGSVSNVNHGSDSVSGQTGTKDVPPQNAFDGNPQNRRKFINSAPIAYYRNGGNTGVLPPQSVISGRSISLLGTGNSGVSRAPTFAYSAPHNFQSSLGSSNLSPGRGLRDGGQKAIRNSPNNRSVPSGEENPSNSLGPITDIINKLPGCPLPGEARGGNHRGPSSRPTSSFRRSITYGGGDSIGVVVTAVNRQAAFYAADPSSARGKNSSEEYQTQVPRGSVNPNNKIKPVLASYQYQRQGSFSQLDRGTRYNNILQSGVANNRGRSDDVTRRDEQNSNFNSQRPQDPKEFNVEKGGSDTYGKNRQDSNARRSSDFDNSNPHSSNVRASGSFSPGSNNQADVDRGYSNEDGFNSNRQRAASAPTAGTRSTQSFDNKLLVNRPQTSTDVGNSGRIQSQNTGHQNIAANKQQLRTNQEYSIYRSPSYETVRSPQPHEKYPAVGIKENFGPAHIAIAPLPPDVDGDEIPGQAWVDYPLYHVIPTTSFSCSQHPLNGYYADVEGSCQVYHFCQPGGAQTSFLCPNGTIFSQKKFACQWWYKTDCTESPHYFSLNSNLYKIPVKINSKQ